MQRMQWGRLGVVFILGIGSILLFPVSDFTGLDQIWVCLTWEYLGSVLALFLSLKMSFSYIQRWWVCRVWVRGGFAVLLYLVWIGVLVLCISVHAILILAFFLTYEGIVWLKNRKKVYYLSK